MEKACPRAPRCAVQLADQGLPCVPASGEQTRPSQSTARAHAFEVQLHTSKGTQIGCPSLRPALPCPVGTACTKAMFGLCFPGYQGSRKLDDLRGFCAPRLYSTQRPHSLHAVLRPQLSTQRPHSLVLYFS